jgi:hypothetical protein
MTNIVKSWKTTTIAVVKAVLGLSLLIMWYLGKINNEGTVVGLVLINFIGSMISDALSKDADKTHSKQAIVGDHPPTDKEEK